MASQRSESLLRELLEPTGVQINGKNPWDLQVHDPRFYDRVFHEPHLAMGEGYMDGWWDCEAIDQMLTRVLSDRLPEKIKGNWKVMLHSLQASLFNRQSSARAYEVGQKHYDLGNDLYCAMLDKRLLYTCGYWKDAVTLDEAQEAKLDLVCKKIGIYPGMRILELGCARA